MYTEIFRLKEMLEKNNIEFEFIDRNKKQLEMHESYQIICTNNNKRFISVIQGTYTYGSREDKLEIMGLLTEEEMQDDGVLGYLTAEEVLKRIKKYLKEVK